jgi:hypothetical protein
MLAVASIESRFSAGIGAVVAMVEFPVMELFRVMLAQLKQLL